MIIYTILIYLFITRALLMNVGSGKPEGKKDHQKDPSDQTLLKWGVQFKLQWTRRDGGCLFVQPKSGHAIDY